MAAPALIETYRQLRKDPLWTFLASDNAPKNLALLQILLFDNERRLKESVMIDRLGRLLNQMSDDTVTREEVVKLLADWRNYKYVLRTLPPKDDEPVYELTVPAFEAISFISSQTQERISPTGSRLELLIHAIRKLVDDTDMNKERRIQRLEEEKRRLEKRIEAIRNGLIKPPSEMEVHAQILDIVNMIESMDSDFLRVRDRFNQLANNLHLEILKSSGSRGDVLERIFAGYDSIRESDEGKTFEKFYTYLYEELTSREMDGLIETLEGRQFWSETEDRYRDVIGSVMSNLNERTSETQQVMRRLATSLRHFVRSKDYLKNRRLQELIDETKKLSSEVAATGQLRPFDPVIILPYSTAQIRSIGEGDLYNPEFSADGESLERSPAVEIDLMALAEQLAASEINFAWLKETITLCLKESPVVSIGHVLSKYPATQGLASVVGYIHIAMDKADQLSGTETIEWVNRLDQKFRAEIPMFIFTRDLLDENGEFH